MNGAVRRVAAYQARAFAGLWFWARRRLQEVGPDDLALSYARDLTPTQLVLAGVLCAETAIVGLLVPWPVVHVLDVLALLQVLGLAATAVTRPHCLRADVLVLREGPVFEVRVPLAAVGSVRAERKYHSGRTLEFTDRELAVVVANQTDVVVTLAEPIAVAGGAEVGVLRFRADDPATAVSAITAALARGGWADRGGRAAPRAPWRPGS